MDRPLFFTVGQTFSVRLSKGIGSQGDEIPNSVFTPFTAFYLTERLGSDWSVQPSVGVGYQIPGGDEDYDNTMIGLLGVSFYRTGGRGNVFAISPSVAFSEDDVSIGIGVLWVGLKRAD
ncbi:hypothetical protein GF377_04585 [candidate division GN15 bacterium]|nr:hypothetical protein [candidate division GN15 bacterium]